MADSRVLVAAAIAGLRQIYKPGVDLIKAGVMLLELQAGTLHQGELALQHDGAGDCQNLMRTLDALNDKFGRGAVLLASEGVAGGSRAWAMRQERRTPNYTIEWSDTPVAKAK